MITVYLSDKTGQSVYERFDITIHDALLDTLLIYSIRLS